MKTILIPIIFSTLLVHGQDDVNTRYKDYTKQQGKIEHFVTKIKENKTVEVYSFNRSDTTLSAYARYQKGSGELIKYFYKDNKLIFCFYRPKNDKDNERKGGLYYFENGKLKEKEEYNIDSKYAAQILEDAKEVITKAILLREKMTQFKSSSS